MKRKIAAIVAADIAGYSKLVAEDEEETLRRLASYRAVFEDFISRFSGRIFNTAGDAVLAEFPSAVEAVRCAIDVQESLRTRNLAYPASRQMSFRIGITVGDVVERDGDLLGDGVNIAARLEGLAQPGGLCVSRTVYEQVSSKLSVEFVDIGEQEVKNIPAPIHAYTLLLGAGDGRVPQGRRKKRASATLVWATAVSAACTAALAVIAGFYLTGLRTDAAPPTPAAPVAKAAPPVPPQSQALVPEAVPFITDRMRAALREEYLPAPDHKALAVSFMGTGLITDQKDDETAKAAALESCQRAQNNFNPGVKCEIYAVGNTVVFARGRVPMPSEPWLVRDTAVERPFAAKDVPLVNDNARGALDKFYRQAHKPKALALAPQGIQHSYAGSANIEEAMRRSLEACGARAGVACTIVAVDDVLVVPIPTTMKTVGFFRAIGNAAIRPDAREDVARRLGNANGWNAVAVGADGWPALVLKATNEQSGIEGALADCSKKDRDCRVIGIGPFAVAPK
jgi:class 3 adenylate cyclase